MFWSMVINPLLSLVTILSENGQEGIAFPAPIKLPWYFPIVLGSVVPKIDSSE